MPRFDILKSSDIAPSFRVAAIRGMFDLKNEKSVERFTGDLNIESEDWQIGAIIGPSGSGKTTILRHLFGESARFDYTRSSVIDDFPSCCDTQSIARSFNSVGFSSAPSWLKPYAVLSNGEQMRVNFARAMMSDISPIVFDEFTSVVDRTVAQIGSAAIAKCIRRGDKKLVVASCHYDIVDWLCPDWVLDTETMTVDKTKKKDQKLSAIFTKSKDTGPFLKSIII